jgi:hypothetical protein
MEFSPAGGEMNGETRDHWNIPVTRQRVRPEKSSRSKLEKSKKGI